MAAPGLVTPQADPGEGEEVHRIGDDVGEERLEVDLATDLRREAAQRVRTGPRVADHPYPAAIRAAPGEPGIEIAAPDEWLVARTDDRGQPTTQAPCPGGAARDRGGGGNVTDAQERIVIRWLECDGHLLGR
jgi:hypothetical protein